MSETFNNIVFELNGVQREFSPLAIDLAKKHNLTVEDIFADVGKLTLKIEKERGLIQKFTNEQKHQGREFSDGVPICNFFINF